MNNDKTATSSKRTITAFSLGVGAVRRHGAAGPTRPTRHAALHNSRAHSLRILDDRGTFAEPGQRWQEAQ